MGHSTKQLPGLFKNINTMKDQKKKKKRERKAEEYCSRLKETNSTIIMGWALDQKKKSTSYKIHKWKKQRMNLNIIVLVLDLLGVIMEMELCRTSLFLGDIC